MYEQNELYKQIRSQVEGITHPYLNVGRIEGGTNTNVVPGKVVLKLDRRMIPEEDPAAVEADIRRVIAEAAARVPGITVEVRRMLLANALKLLAGNAVPLDAKQVASIYRDHDGVWKQSQTCPVPPTSITARWRCADGPQVAHGLSAYSSGATGLLAATDSERAERL